MKANLTTRGRPTKLNRRRPKQIMKVIFWKTKGDRIQRDFQHKSYRLVSGQWSVVSSHLPRIIVQENSTQRQSQDSPCSSTKENEWSEPGISPLETPVHVMSGVIFVNLMWTIISLGTKWELSQEKSSEPASLLTGNPTRYMWVEGGIGDALAETLNIL